MVIYILPNCLPATAFYFFRRVLQTEVIKKHDNCGLAGYNLYLNLLIIVIFWKSFCYFILISDAYRFCNCLIRTKEASKFRICLPSPTPNT